MEDNARDSQAENKVTKALDWAYSKAIDKIPGLDSAQMLADEYLKTEGSLVERANRLIRWQNSKAGTSGFLTGLGGVITMPVTIPANVASVMYLQLRMIAAIAIMGGHDVRSDRVKALAYACLAGNGAVDIFKDAGLIVGTKLATNAIKSISGKTIVAINQRVGFRLITKFGTTGAVNLTKFVPLLGGIVSGVFDAVTTNVIGNIARNTFISGDFDEITFPTK